jgi:hypothetical protein
MGEIQTLQEFQLGDIREQGKTIPIQAKEVQALQWKKKAGVAD